MRSRLRKTLAGVLPEEKANCRLNRDKVMIRLARCRVDALDFLRKYHQFLPLNR